MERLGSVLEAPWWGLRCVLGRFGGILGASWVVLGVIAAPSGRLGGILGVDWGVLGRLGPVPKRYSR